MSTRTSPALFHAGAAQVDITPRTPQFLFGYPHVRRTSTAVHDPLLASALFIDDSAVGAIFVGCDLIFIPRELSQRARRRIAQHTGVPAQRIMITATHTHSGPITTSMLSNRDDPIVPEPDPRYLQHVEQGIVDAAVAAHRDAAPAVVSHALADGSPLGTNRRDPAGPSIPRIPVIVVRDPGGADAEVRAVMAVVNMHPTVLHEDWTRVSGDFPGLGRQWLQRHKVGPSCPLVVHLGASGNQSPRHVVQGNTIEEAQRLGTLLGEALGRAIDEAQPITTARVRVLRTTATLPVRRFGSVEQAQAGVESAVEKLRRLRESGAPHAEVRTAECDWFGAEETLTLAKAHRSGALAEAAASRMPAEIQAIAIGPHVLVGWPGEVFVEFALSVTERFPQASVITLANSDLEGYLVTQAAVDEGGYEASNAVFASPAGGEALVEQTLSLLHRLSEGEAEP